jgi:RHS repeat-associated protein
VWLQTTGDAGDNDIDMDDLSYTYDKDGLSNLLVNVSDAVTTGSSEGFKDGNTDPNLDDYEYDANGNMIKDRNKGISNITYNHLNLPTQIEFEGTTNKITYLYNAVGQKLNKKVIYSDSIKVVDYLDGFQYAGGVLQFFPHPEGYVKATPTDRLNTNYGYNYVFNYTDHLGNVRLSYSKDPQTNQLKILDENHYYPFGLRHSVYSAGRLRDFEVDLSNPEEEKVFLTPVTKTEYQYKFGAKEWQDELGLGWYDYHARNYDPALGRWNVIDPMAPKYFSHSPYAYTLNNPVYFIDPTGMMAEIGNLLGNGDPVEICEGCLVELEEALITAKDTQKSSSFGSRSRSGSLMTMSGFSSSRFSIGRNIFGYNYEKYSDLYNDPDWFAGYKKMYQAKREGEWFAVGVFGSVLAPAILPEIITFGSIKIFSTKAAISATAQIVVNGDVDLIDVAADATLIPGVSGAVGGVADFNVKEDRKLEINTDPNSILINSATSIMSGGMGSRFNSSIKQLPSTATQTAAEVMIKTPHSIVEQSLNKTYGDENK